MLALHLLLGLVQTFVLPKPYAQSLLGLAIGSKHIGQQVQNQCVTYAAQQHTVSVLVCLGVCCL